MTFAKDELRLRRADPSDWPAISALLIANQLPLDGARMHLSDYVVALAGGEIVGTAGLELYGDIALLRSVAVAPGAHGQGIGKTLMDLVLEDAERRGVRHMHLLTVTAPDYFVQFGFERETRDRAPAALQASAEFQGACPASSTFMSRVCTLGDTRKRGVLLVPHSTPASRSDAPTEAATAFPAK